MSGISRWILTNISKKSRGKEYLNEVISAFKNMDKVNPEEEAESGAKETQEHETKNEAPGK